MGQHWIAFGVIAGIIAGGCGGRGGSVDELTSLLEVLANPNASPARFSKRVYELLDERSQAAVEARAKALGQALGATVEPSDVLQMRGVVDNARISNIDVQMQGEDHATVELTLTSISFADSKTAAAGPPKPASGEITQATRVRLPVVREDGSWRIAFTDFADLVASLPLDAAPKAGPPAPGGAP